MGFSDINANRRKSIIDLMALKQTASDKIGQGLDYIFDAATANRKYKEDAATREDEQLFKAGEDNKYRLWDQEQNRLDRELREREGIADRESREREGIADRESREREGALDRALRGDEEDTYYPTSDMWIMMMWDEFANYAGITDMMGNPTREPTNEDYKKFRYFIESEIRANDYPTDKEKEALDNLSRYLSDKYTFTPGNNNPNDDRNYRSFRINDGVMSREEADTIFPGEVYPERQPLPPIETNNLFEDFRGGEPNIPKPDIDITEKEEKAYQRLLELIEQYGEHPDFMKEKELLEGQGAPLFATENSLLKKIERILERIR